MNLPNGLRRPTYLPLLILAVALFLGVCVFTYGFVQTLLQNPPMVDVPAPQATDLPSSLFGFESLFGVGVAILLLALVWGMVRYVTRDRSRDAQSEAATRELYRPENRSHHVSGG